MGDKEGDGRGNLRGTVGGKVWTAEGIWGVGRGKLGGRFWRVGEEVVLGEFGIEN